MSIASEITLLNNTKQSIKEAIQYKGVTMESENDFTSYPSEILKIPKGTGVYESNVIAFIEGTMVDYIIPSGTTVIGDYSFTYSPLSDVNMPVLTENLTIPSGVTTIGIRAFYDQDNLVSVSVPNTVTSIGAGAFSACSSLTTINIPNGVTTISDNLFSSCSSLAGITIPNSVTSIGDSAFLLTGLTSITIPNSVTSIGSSAFSSCYSLDTVTIPSSVTSIGGYAFYRERYGDTGFDSITVEATTPPTLGEYVFDSYYGGMTYPIYVPAESLLDYMVADGWSRYASRLQPINNS